MLAHHAALGRKVADHALRLALQKTSDECDLSEIVKLLLAGVKVERSGHGLDEPAEPAVNPQQPPAAAVQVNINLDTAIEAARKIVADRNNPTLSASPLNAQQQSPAPEPGGRRDGTAP
jgi:hypothetical protein